MGDRADPVTLDHLQCLRVLHGEVTDLDHSGHQSHGGDCLDSLDPLFLLRAQSWLLGKSSLYFVFKFTNSALFLTPLFFFGLFLFFFSALLRLFPGLYHL